MGECGVGGALVQLEGEVRQRHGMAEVSLSFSDVTKNASRLREVLGFFGVRKVVLDGPVTAFLY